MNVMSFGQDFANLNHLVVGVEDNTFRLLDWVILPIDAIPGPININDDRDVLRGGEKSVDTFLFK